MKKLAILLAALVALTACSSSKDAVVIGGTFEFVAPGGQTVITYDDPSSRGTVGNLAGPSLLNVGQTVGLDDHPGRVVVVNIWGSWCGPCREEAPNLEFAQQQTASIGGTVLGIDIRDDRQAATDFVRDRGLTYDSIYDDSGRSLANLRGLPRNVVPQTIVLDKQHRVAAVYLRVVQVAELIPLIQRLAAEQPPAAAAPGVPG